MTKKNVLITGASSGLGEAMAKRFARAQTNLTLSARRVERLKGLKDALNKTYPDCDVLIVPADVADKQSCKELVHQSVSHFSKIDVFVANAGLGMWCKFSDLSDPDQLKDLMQTNYMGMVYGLFYSLPHLRKAHGSFVAISSIQGTIPVAFHTGYVASKYAVNGLIETIRLEEPDVHFLLALPSWISGTELRTNALSGVGTGAVKVKTTHGKSAVSADDCAQKIVSALMDKKTEIFIPKKYRLVPLLRAALKSTFDRVVMNKVKTQLKS